MRRSRLGGFKSPRSLHPQAASTVAAAKTPASASRPLATATSAPTIKKSAPVSQSAPAVGIKPVLAASSAGPKRFKPPTARPGAVVKKFQPPTAVSSASTAGSGGGGAGSGGAGAVRLYFTVLYTKYSKKKHKTYDDGLLVFAPETRAILQSMEGKEIAKEMTRLTKLRIGETLSIRNYDLEVVNNVPAAEYESGRIFIAAGGGSTSTPASNAPPSRAKLALAASLSKTSTGLGQKRSGLAIGSGSAGPGGARSGSEEKPGAIPRGVRARFDPYSSNAIVLQWPEGGPRTSADAAARMHAATAAATAASSSSSSGVADPSTKEAPSRLALQHASGVIGPRGRPQVPVVVDPALAAALRPHQRKGIRFLWECVAGMRPFSGTGAILADAMGLGKTLQAITLIQCALKQSIHGVPLANKAVVVCPSSLVAGWKKEFRKWLGDQKCRPVAVTTGGKTAETAVRDFCLSSSAIAPVLIISYEQFRRYAPLINGGAAAAAATKPAATKKKPKKKKVKPRRGAFGKKAADDDDDEEDPEAEAAAEAAMAAARGKRKGCEIGLLVCDEGHRLKNSEGNQTIKALASCPCRRRVILTGTPIQNRLDEFFACCSFVNPDVLGPLTTFRRVFQTPIQRGRDRSATPVEQSIGEERSKELARLSTQFILRRTQRILDKYLPAKTESCVFCQPTEQQLRLYAAVLAGAVPRGVGGGATAEALRAIGLLRQLCNSPALLWATAVRDGIAAGEEGATELFETTTLRQTAAAVVAAMHRQMGVQGGSGGQSTSKKARAATNSSSRSAPSLLQLSATADGPNDDDDNDSLGSLEDFIVEDDTSAAPIAAAAADDDDDEEEEEDRDAAAISESATSKSGGSSIARQYKAPLHAKRRSPLSAFDADWHKCPDPMRAALKGLGWLSDDGKSVAAGCMLPVRSGSSSAIPQTFHDAGDVLAASSGKMQLLDALIESTCFPQTAASSAASSSSSSFSSVTSAAGDKLVIVSNYTSALDVIAQLCCCRGVPFLRLDGSTTSDKRASLVAAFNAATHPSRLLLLSSRAGGVGLNLIGANRLVLFDVDWNPATDRQAMARVWRDGQKKRCAIYRFALAGTLEEKVLQRQLLKEEVSSAIVDGDTSAARSFSADELRRLFDPPTTEPLGTCTTYAMLNQQKQARTAQPQPQAKADAADADAVAADADADAEDMAEAEEIAEGEGPEDNGLSSWGVYEGAHTIMEDDSVLASAIRSAGSDKVCYAQCTWFNKPSPAPDAAPERPQKRGLDGVIRATPAEAAIADNVAPVSITAALSTAAAGILADHTSSPVDSTTEEADPKRAKPAEIAAADDIMSAILTGDAAPTL